MNPDQTNFLPSAVLPPASVMVKRDADARPPCPSWDFGYQALVILIP